MVNTQASSDAASAFVRCWVLSRMRFWIEAVETIIGAMANDDENFLYEAGDLLYHLIVLLTHKGYRIEDIVRELKKRHK